MMEKEYPPPYPGEAPNYQGQPTNQVNPDPVWLRNWLISAGLEPVLSNTKKSCIAWYYWLFSSDITMHFIELKPVLLAGDFSLSGLTWF